MKNQTTDKFNSETVFNEDLLKILKKQIEEKINPFLEYCIHTHNAEPIKQVIYLINVNTFEYTTKE